MDELVNNSHHKLSGVLQHPGFLTSSARLILAEIRRSRLPAVVLSQRQAVLKINTRACLCCKVKGSLGFPLCLLKKWNGAEHRHLSLDSVGVKA